MTEIIFEFDSTQNIKQEENKVKVTTEHFPVKIRIINEKTKEVVTRVITATRSHKQTRLVMS
jgi:hypothetical protein